MSKTIIDMLEKTSTRFPNKTAFILGKDKITYSEFVEESKKLGTYLAKTEKFKKPVAILLDKNIGCLISMIGTIYSGNYYIVLDSKSPVDRLQQIIDTLDNPIIITDEVNKKTAENLKNYDNMYLASEMRECDIDNDILTNIRKKVIDTDIMYILFTSGSTGVPKGTVLQHKAVLSYLDWFVNCFKIDDNTIFGSQTPFYFSMSVSDVYSTMVTGATLCIIPKMYFSFPVKLLSYLKEEKINTIYWVPSALCIIANLGALKNNDLTDLKKILFAGEVMPTKQLNMWLNNVDAMYANLYGPTETVDICTYYKIDRKLKDDESIPIGYGCDNCDIIILTEDNKEAKVGEVGELCVRGSFLAAGYYKNLEKTNQVFVQNPLNLSYPEKIYKTGDLVKINDLGEIVYLSRKDYQIKHMGYRIELGEIETKISSIDKINTCCTIYDEKKDKIVLYYQSNELNDYEILEKARAILPAYMVPNVVLKLDRVPYNANGKIDRKKLKSDYEKSED